MLRPLPLRFSLVAIALLGLLLGALLSASRADDRLHIMLPAIEGNGALVITPGGQTILIDGGADGAALATWLGSRLPFGTRSIDLLILTHPDASTLPGQLAAIRRYHIGQALIAGIGEQSSHFIAWQQLLAKQRTPVRTLQAGNQIQLGPSNLRVLTAEAGRMTLVVQWQQTMAYFLQALDDSAEAALEAQSLSPAALVIFPWEHPTNIPLLQALQPMAIVFSEGGEGSTQQSFAQRRVGQAQLLHEELDGEIRFVSDGQQAQVEIERKEAQ